MAAPTECEITFPTDGWTAGAGPGGTATIGCDATSDAEEGANPEIQFLIDDVVAEEVATDVDGNLHLAVDFPIGTSTLTANAVNDDGSFESAPVDVTVLDMTENIGNAADRSVRWYLNFLAGNTVYNVADPLLPSIRSAACKWAGVSEVNYGTIGALNAKAGRTDPLAYASQNACLNLIAYDTDDFNDCVPWLTDQEALFMLATA